MIANPGTYVVQARHGSNAPCGVYIAGLHNEIINVEISLVDVTCKTGGLMAVIFFSLKSHERIFSQKAQNIGFLSILPLYSGDTEILTFCSSFNQSEYSSAI